MLERERIIEIVVAVTAVALMIGVMVGIGTNYTVNDTELTAEGGEMLVGAIIGFIILLTFIGVGLAYALNDPEDGLEEEDAETKNAA
ncbi:DUF7472 family protein [Natrononativus amylolyticus]|uniref:DUF7472 family protein n=1 Tax=Natrononativus amylolyticus TaxID=2963434 RepID=UPI0020CCB21E|nr:hypothetical protein [Natrononativus amylolyticus]